MTNLNAKQEDGKIFWSVTGSSRYGITVGKQIGTARGTHFLVEHNEDGYWVTLVDSFMVVFESTEPVQSLEEAQALAIEANKDYQIF